MVLIHRTHGISSGSLWDARICHWGHDGAVCCVAVCTGSGCGASELAIGDDGLLISGVTGCSSVDGSGLVGSIAGHISLLLLVYLVPELAWTW